MASPKHFYDGLQPVTLDQAGLEVDGGGLEPARDPHEPSNWPSADQQFSQGKGEKNQRDPKKLFGIRRTTLLLAILIIILIAAVAAVAGVLGTRQTNGIKSPGQSSSPSPTSQHASPPSTSSTSSATASASPYSCTNNGTLYQTSDNSVFTVYCNTNFLVGANYHTTAAVLTVLNLNSFGACLEACAISNSLKVTYENVGTCQSATWFGSGTELDQCFLKNATAKTDGSNGLYQPGDPGSQTGSLTT